MRTFFTRLVLLCFVAAELAIPATALSAGSACAIKAEDTIAGLGTQVTLTDCKEFGSSAVISVQPPQGTASTVTAAIGSQGNASVFIPGKNTRMSGTYDVTAGSQKTTFDVLPDAMSTAHSTLTDDGQTVTLVLRDQYRNPIGAHPIALIASRSADIVPLGKETDDSGKIQWTVSSQGSLTLTAYDILSGKTITALSRGSLPSALAADLTSGTSTQGDITFGAIDHFSIALAKDGSVKANDSVSIVVTALDHSNRVVEDFTGPLEFSSTDSDADFPTGSSFRPQDLGVRSFPLAFVFRTPGTQTLKVRSKDTTSIVGSLDIVVTGGGETSGGAIQILDPKQNAYVNQTEILVQGKAPSLINVHVKGGLEEATGETDAEGVFRVQVKLNPDQRDQTLIVESENKQYESAPLHIILLMGQPGIQSIVLDPQNGKEGQTATVTVVAEAGLPEVKAQIGSETSILKESPSGTYVGTFTAPVKGSYDVLVTATDQAGNAKEMTTKWAVGSAGMPTVTGVKAQSLPQMVDVSWQAVDSAVNVKLYRIYIAAANDPNNILHQLDVPAGSLSAKLKGLETGKSYLFSMTAVGQSGEESDQRSEAAQASPIGLSITAVPGDSSVMLNISAPPSLTLLKYVVEIGTEPGVYPIKLSMDPAQSIKIPDLINGITYQLRVTPVLINGKSVDELATALTSTPTGSGFTPGTSDPIPGWKGGAYTSSSASHPAAGYPPSGSIIGESGIPQMAAVVLLIIAGLASTMLWQHRRHKVKAQHFLEMMEMRYHQ